MPEDGGLFDFGLIDDEAATPAATKDEKMNSMFDFDDLPDVTEAPSTSLPGNDAKYSSPNPFAAKPAAPGAPSRAASAPTAKAGNPLPVPKPAPAPAAAPPPPSEASRAKSAPEQTASNGATGGAGDGEDYSRYSVKELRAMAAEKNIGIDGCVEKSDIIERLKRGPLPAAKVAAKAKRGKAATTTPKSSPKPAPFSDKRPEPFQEAKVPPKSSPKGKSQAREEWPSGPPKKSGGAGSNGGSNARGGAKAKAPSAKAQAESIPVIDEDGERDVGNWSPRVMRWFNQYPGFAAILPPEAEMWSDMELEIYFGSNGDIWPRGKRPAWINRPGASAPQAQAEKKAPEAKVYPELRPHFKTLDIAETTPADMIKRHYKRLALELHPDKHPDDVEEFTEKFRLITEAYDAIKERLRF